MSEKLPLSKDILRKIKSIEIQTRRLINSSLFGDSRSAQKGAGFEFDQIRDYQVGDDVRYIDWHASARSNKLLVKQYIQERGRVILLAVDISDSGLFSSSAMRKKELMATIASALSIVADYAKDQVGLLLFSDSVEKYIAPRSGTSHVRSVIRTLFEHKAQQKKTSIGAALKRLIELKKKNALAFLISDFIDDMQTIDNQLSIASRMYDLIAIRCLDTNEYTLPMAGFITMEDIETGQEVLVDLRKNNLDTMSVYLKQRIDGQDRLFKKYGIDYINASDDDSFIAEIVRFFRRRMLY